jgi:radical SAM protein with 4Fe4S-binding SPASM domain
MSDINEVVIEVTMKCNRACDFCFNKIYAKDFDFNLKTDEIKIIIDKVADSGASIIRFTGGEPLIRDDIFELMEYAYSKGLKVWLNTNGTLITKENARKISEFVENVLLPFNSLGHEPSIENAINHLKDGVKIIICGTVALRENIDNLEKFLEVVKKLNIDDWEIFRPIPIKINDNLMNHNDVKKVVEKLITFKKTFGKTYYIANALPFCSYNPKKVDSVSYGAVSDDGHSRFIVSPNGTVRPSYFITEKIGNLLKDSVEDCWNNDFMIKMRNLKFVPDQCKDCDYVEKCRGGSRFVANLVNGSYMSLDPLAKRNTS